MPSLESGGTLHIQGAGGVACQAHGCPQVVWRGPRELCSVVSEETAPMLPTPTTPSRTLGSTSLDPGHVQQRTREKHQRHRGPCSQPAESTDGSALGSEALCCTPFSGKTPGDVPYMCPLSPELASYHSATRVGPRSSGQHPHLTRQI